jgi:hypothetical protein
MVENNELSYLAKTSSIGALIGFGGSSMVYLCALINHYIKSKIEEIKRKNPDLGLWLGRIYKISIAGTLCGFLIGLLTLNPK